MAFPTDTLLEDVLKYVQASIMDKVTSRTASRSTSTPQASQDADKSPASTIQINLKDIPLATTLKLVLNQLVLLCRVNSDGLIQVTSSVSGDDSVDSGNLILDEIQNL